MIDDDVRALERKVFLSKLQFAIFFAVITLINFLPYFLVCLFRGIVSGMTLLVISLFILAATVLLLFWLGKRALMRLIGATPISQEKYREILGLSEDISLATGKPIPELMIIDDPSCCNLFSIHTRGGGIIFIGKRLFEVMSPAELRASLAHEMAHIHQGDVRTNTLTIVLRAEMETISNSRLGLFVLDLLYALPVVIIIVSAVLLVDKTFALPYILPLVILWPVVYIAILGQYYSAFLYDIDLSRDLYADELAAKWTQDPEALLAAMKKAQRNDMSKEIAFLENIPFVPTIRENPHKYMHSAMVERRLVHLEQATHLPVEPELEVN